VCSKNLITHANTAGLPQNRNLGGPGSFNSENSNGSAIKVDGIHNGEDFHKSIFGKYWKNQKLAPIFAQKPTGKVPKSWLGEENRDRIGKRCRKLELLEAFVRLMWKCSSWHSRREPVPHQIQHQSGSNKPTGMASTCSTKPEEGTPQGWPSSPDWLKVAA